MGSVLFSLILALRFLVVLCYGADWSSCYKGYCYHRSLTSFKSWSQSRAYCKSLGTDLVSIHSEAENTFIYHNICYMRRKCAIGLHDAKTTNLWVWTDGSVVDYSNWCPGQPNHNYQHHGTFWNDAVECWKDVRDKDATVYALCQRLVTSPSTTPSTSPSAGPSTVLPSNNPTEGPSTSSTVLPSNNPTMGPSISPTYNPTVTNLPESSAVKGGDETIDVLGMSMTFEALIFIGILATLVCCLCFFILCAGLLLKSRNSHGILIQNIVEAINMSSLVRQGGEKWDTNAHMHGEGVG